MTYVMLKTLNQFFGFKETLEVPHLPNACKEENDRLRDGPPEYPLVGALTGHAEPLFSELQREQSSQHQEHAWPNSSCHASFNCCPPPDRGLVEMQDLSSFTFQASSTTLPISSHAERKPASLPTVKYGGGLFMHLYL